jgi:ATP-dependent DNA helicase PIF1
MSTAFQYEEVESRVGSVACRYVSGPAGTGKTYAFKQRIDADETEGVLCATTGVAAVNLNTTTINSLLGYFDLESMSDAFVTGQLTRRMIDLRKRYGYRSIMLDEASMLPAAALDILTEAAKKANARMDGLQIALELTGDFAQLPPIEGEWAFKASNWDAYAANITRLDHIYRQSDPEFLAALGLARRGDGPNAASALRHLASWTTALDLNFPGTTIVDKNSKVDDINTLRYMKLTSPEKLFRSVRWGKQRGEWKQIPEALRLRIGALVMILNNGYTERGMDGQRELIYANGDTGEITQFEDAGTRVRLKRTGEEVTVPYVTRNFESKDERTDRDDPRSYYDEVRKRWVLGRITYYPMRLAYAVTVHKSQGLTLEHVQLDPRGRFFGSPNMAYVALSRVKSPHGLRIIGTPEMFAKRINVDKDVSEWI